jgi:hypothetical protein
MLSNARLLFHCCLQYIISISSLISIHNATSQHSSLSVFAASSLALPATNGNAPTVHNTPNLALPVYTHARREIFAVVLACFKPQTSFSYISPSKSNPPNASPISKPLTPYTEYNWRDVFTPERKACVAWLSVSSCGLNFDAQNVADIKATMAEIVTRGPSSFWNPGSSDNRACVEN